MFMSLWFSGTASDRRTWAARWGLCRVDSIWAWLPSHQILPCLPEGWVKEEGLLDYVPRAGVGRGHESPGTSRTGAAFQRAAGATERQEAGDSISECWDRGTLCGLADENLWLQMLKLSLRTDLALKTKNTGAGRGHFIRVLLKN